MERRWGIALRVPPMVLVLFALASAGCSDAHYQFPPIRIGVIVSLTGGLGPFGTHLQQTAQLVAREVNASGGLLDGRPVELVVEDDRTDSMVARRVAERLVNEEGVVAIIGSLASGSSLTAQEITGPARVPQVSCCSTSPDLTGAQPEGDRYLFRTVPPDDLQAVVIARHVSESLTCDRLAVMHLNDAYGTPFGMAIEQQVRGAGGTVVIRQPFADTSPTYTAEVSMVAAANPDCIALIAFVESGGRIIRDWYALPTPPAVQFIGTDGIRDPDLVTHAGRADIVNGIIGTAPITAPGTSEFMTYVESFEASYSTAPGLFGASQYDAAALVMLGIEWAGTTEGTALRDGIFTVSRPSSGPGELFFGPGQIGDALIRIREGTDIDYAGASGPVDLDGFGNVVSDYEIWRYDGASMGFQRVSIIRATEL